MKPLLAAVVFGLFTALACQAELQLPEPPQQHTTWRLDSPIPPNILSAAETMFEQGFPDPCGCEYREIEVECGVVFAANLWPVKSRGWVLPAQSKETNRFAICWNGIIYPVVTVGAPANLHDEISNNRFTVRYDPGRMEAQAVFFRDAPPTRSLLLLRSGEIAAGLEDWQAVEQMLNSDQRRRPGASDA